MCCQADYLMSDAPPENALFEILQWHNAKTYILDI